MHDGWDPSSAPYEATFTVGQTAGANGQVPRQRGWVQKKKRPGREGEREREGQEVWLSVRAVTRRGKCRFG